MNKGFWNHRRYIFLLFLLTFFVSAPLVVLYTAGYRYNFSTGTVLRTGILSAASIPKGATVFIDGIASGETPLIIKTIIPGVHTIKIEAEDYLPWQKNIRIESRQTAFVTPNLLKDSPRETRFSQKNEQVLYVLKDFHIIHTNTETGTISITDLENQITKTILEETNTKTPRQNVNVLLSPTEDIILVSYKNEKGDQKYNLFSTTSGESYEFPVFSDDEPILSVWFDNGNEKSLHILKKDNLWEYNLENKKLAIIGPPSIKQSMWFGNELLVLQDAGSFVSVGFLKGETTSITTYLPQTPDGQYFLQKAPGNRILITEKTQHTLSLINPQNTTNPLEMRVNGLLASFESNGDRLLYTDGFEVFLYNTYSKERETLTRISKPITQLLWHPNSDWILFGTDGELNALETFTTHGDRAIFPLAEGTKLQTTLQKNGKSLIILDFEGDINTVDSIEL